MWTAASTVTELRLTRPAEAEPLLGDPRPVPVREVRSRTLAPPVALFTLVVWAVVVVTGLTGLLVEPVRAIMPAAEPPPVQAELLTVELAVEPVVVPVPAPELALAEPPPASPVAEPPSVPLAEVAPPDLLVAFALPVEGPVRQVANPAAVVNPAPPVVVPSAAAAVQSLEFGRGKGRQPKPEYPRQAQRERQEGRPGVRFAVDASGRVAQVNLSSPSPWPLLNHAAVDVIRRHWQFQPADAGWYEVFIKFELKR